MQATAITNAVTLTSHETLPNGVKVAIVPCADFAALQALPRALSFEGRTYGRSGWNSDRCVAYFRSDWPVAIGQ